MKKRILVVAVAASMLTVALLGSAAFAHFGGLGGGQGAQDETYAVKVAEILGLDAETVQAAMQQAAEELREEAQTNRLQGLVEQGVITQEEADQWREWLSSRPQVQGLGEQEGRGGLGIGHRGQGAQDGTYAAKLAEILGLDAETVQAAMQQAAEELRDEAQTNRLQGLVEQGVITQEEADQWREWLSSRPQVQGLGDQEGRGGHGFGHRGGRGFGPRHLPTQESAPAPDGASFVY